MKAIVAAASDWGIGYEGQLLQWIPEDMKFFKAKTLQKVVVMGRTTFESLPGKAPLKDRINIVLSKRQEKPHDAVILCRSLPELWEELKQYNTNDIFVIGGASVYHSLLPYCSEAYVTKIFADYQADKYFDNLDTAQEWKLVETSEMHVYKELSFQFTKYENQQILVPK
ncbi:MAG: dihydrofolate reductase [Sporomusaceae bacterium]|nr:dihydrofolate reductase [Sporomusaceae bacterium]